MENTQVKSEKEQCSNCRFWREYPKTLGFDGKGDCHKNAPVVAGTSESGYGCWPDTKSNDWCGEWEAKK